MLTMLAVISLIPSLIDLPTLEHERPQTQSSVVDPFRYEDGIRPERSFEHRSQHSRSPCVASGQSQEECRERGQAGCWEVKERQPRLGCHEPSNQQRSKDHWPQEVTQSEGVSSHVCHSVGQRQESPNLGGSG